MTSIAQLMANPIATEYKETGPLAGVTAANQYQDWRDSQDRSFRSSDLAYNSDKNKYENEMLDNPVLAAKRQLDTSKMGLEQEQYDTGKMKESIEAERTAKLSEATARMTTGQLTDVHNRGKAVQAAYSDFEMDESKSPLSFGRNKDYYENQFLPLMKQMGAGNKYPPIWGPEAKAAVEKANQGAIQDIPQIQKTLLEKQKNDAALKLHKQDKEASLEIAKVMSAGRAELAADKLPELAQIKNKIEKEGGYDNSDVRRLQALYDTEKGPKQKDALQGQKDKWERDFYTSSPEQQRVMAKEVGLPDKAKPTDYADAKFKRTEKALRDDWVESQLSQYKPKTASAKAAASTTGTQAPQGTKLPDGSIKVPGGRMVPNAQVAPQPQAAAAAVPPLTAAGVSPNELAARQGNAGGILDQVMKSIMPRGM